MIERIYYTSPYTTKWTASILSAFESNNHYYVELNKTAFYPEGGGQPSDTGTIAGHKVLDVVEKDHSIFHEIDTLLEVNTRVECEINWNRRFDHMQQHTGQHLLSAILSDVFNIHTVSFHLGKDIASIDVNVSSINEDTLIEIEQTVNKAIYANKPLSTYYVSQDQLSTLSLRKMPDLEDEQIRIVEIDTLDTSACCGTHVRSTGELGIIKLLKTEKQRGQIRLFFKCGMRALKDYEQTHRILSHVSHHFSTKSELILERLQKLEADFKILSKQNEVLKSENAHYLAQSLLDKKQGIVLVHEFEDKTLKDGQAIIKQLLQTENMIGIFSSSLEPKVILAHSTDRIHSGNLFKEHLNRFNGKGGGGINQAQAQFSTMEDRNHFISYLQEYLQKV
ncbi:alanyl-tRNA editing protein [Priestia flexa]|uniref:alanyl-tRNA editing protein n=1 Tax=Priestia flexa TaxID=86664 RepID=UPI0024939013|nr:alanine--tRNA ligase-related protein [Priestia flexa]